MYFTIIIRRSLFTLIEGSASVLGPTLVCLRGGGGGGSSGGEVNWDCGGRFDVDLDCYGHLL